MKVSDTEELGRVMDEIREAMGAETSILTIHVDDAPPRALFSGSAQETLVRQLLARLPKADLFKTAEPRWIDGEADGAPFRALAMPVQEVPGHARLVVSAIFGRVDDIHSEAAEQTYWRRRPFAVGYRRGARRLVTRLPLPPPLRKRADA